MKNIGQNKKIYWCTNNIKIENNELKKVGTKNRACCHFDKIIKLEDFDFDNILLEKKSCEKNLIYDVSYKLWLAQNLCILCLIK